MTLEVVIAHFVGSTRRGIVVQRDLIMPSKQRPHGPATGRFFRTTSFILLLACSHWSAAAGSAMEDGFRTVPDGARPWAYWWWLNGNIDEPTITRDLEAMRQQGFGGFLLFDARGYHDDQSHVVVPPPKMEFMSEEWRRMLRFALHKADALGLEVSVNLSSCAGALKGPWEVGSDSPKKLIWTATPVRGPQRFTHALQKPDATYFWDIAVIAVPAAGRETPVPGAWREAMATPDSTLTVESVVDLRRKVDKQGRLVWDVPEGDWTLLQFGCTTMDGHEYDVDILDPKAVAGHFERMGETILRDAGPLAGKTLTHFYSVSWEGAAPTWTLRLEKDFAKYRGYALKPWLPVLAGFTVQSRDASARFLRDYYRTLGDCFSDHFYGTMQQLSRRHGLKWHSESGGPWNRKLEAFAVADQLAFLGRNDMPQGEFWFSEFPPKRSREMNRPSAMTAHIYGRNLAATEAFTHMTHHWSAYPAVLKPFADMAFIDGINHFIWHTFTASPEAFGKPGSEYFAGTHINPNVTWAAQSAPFIGYLARCQFMLRQGHFVSDVCAYIGDQPYQHWGRGTNWSPRATLSLPRGYTYDLLNTEVLLDRVKVRGRDLLLPDGMSYRMLVVDLEEEEARPAVLRKITQLKNDGAAVVFGQRRPLRAPGLPGPKNSDEEVQRRGHALWANSPALPEVLQTRKMAPDFEGPADYTHRRTAEADIYFVTGSGRMECVFRVHGKQPELWDAVSGKVSDASRWSFTGDGRTQVSLDLPRHGSMFVVFRKPPGPATGSPTPEVTERMDLAGPWKVTFAPGRGAPESAVLETLIPWNEHPDDGIRFFSGTATYRKVFDIGANMANRNARLQLGRVECIARVRLNGKDLGIVWTDPWLIALTGELKPGRNELEIEITNTWVNRLIGDAALPPAKRITRSNVALQAGPRTLKPYQGFASQDPLMISGLLGPVQLEFLD